VEWRQIVVIAFVLMVSGFISGGVSHAELKLPVRIGVLTVSWGPSPSVVGLREGLLALGYREDKDFYLGVRFTQGDISALNAAARELVQHGVDIIIADADAETMAARQATRQIPIVSFANDPVGLGLAQSFARPGGNITGVTSLNVHLGPKRLELFQEMIPTLKRVLFPYDAADIYAVNVASAYREAAQHLGIALLTKSFRTQEEARSFFAQLRPGDVDVILAPATPALNIAGFALEAGTQQAIPVLAGVEFYPDNGGLASYGPQYHESGRQAARLVDKIIKGADPATIPIEVNPNIEFVINLKVAKALGLTIAPVMLFQANRIIR